MARGKSNGLTSTNRNEGMSAAVQKRSHATSVRNPDDDGNSYLDDLLRIKSYLAPKFKNAKRYQEAAAKILDEATVIPSYAAAIMRDLLAADLYELELWHDRYQELLKKDPDDPKITKYSTKYRKVRHDLLTSLNAYKPTKRGSGRHVNKDEPIVHRKDSTAKKNMKLVHD